MNIRIDENAVNAVLTANPFNAAGTALRLAWLAGLRRREIIALTWTQVDLTRQSLFLPDRTVPLNPELEEFLIQRGTGGSFVLLSDRDHKPLTPQSVSRLARQALNRGGLLQISLDDLRHDFIRRQIELHGAVYAAVISGTTLSHAARKNAVTSHPANSEQNFAPENMRKQPVLSDTGNNFPAYPSGNGRIAQEERRLLLQAAQSGCLMRRDAAELLQVTDRAAYWRLKRLVEKKQLVQIGSKYYPPGSVVPPEKQEETILAFLQREPFAYRQDIASLLGIDPLQCRKLLRDLVSSGKVIQRQQRYFLSTKSPDFDQTEPRKLLTSGME